MNTSPEKGNRVKIIELTVASCLVFPFLFRNFLLLLLFTLSLGELNSVKASPDSIANRNSEKLGSRSPYFSHQSYILGSGDSILVEVSQIPELSGVHTIGPDGTIYLPYLRSLYVEGLTVGQVSTFLESEFRSFVKNPSVYIKPVGYRAVRIYVGGEVYRPGYYMLSGTKVVSSAISDISGVEKLSISSGDPKLTNRFSIQDDVQSLQGVPTSSVERWPTLFDALRASQGVTPFSDLSSVTVTRRLPGGSSDKKLQAKINFLEMILDGNEEVNIKLFDGDTIRVGKSKLVLRDQLLAASKTNLSPDFIEVFVSGRVKEPGAKSLPQGSTLNQAIASSGGTDILKGGVEFLRFGYDGSSDRRVFRYSPNSASGSKENPVLMPGDIIRVNDSFLSASVKVLNELTGPLVGIYSVYSLFR